MANVKVSDLAELTSLADNDLFLIADDSETSSEKSKKVKFSTLFNRIVPAGMVMPFAGSAAPTGWLECDGSEVSRTTYATLFGAIGTVYGEGNESTTFNLPDYRGMFLRGYNNNRSDEWADPGADDRTDSGDGTVGDNVGTLQAGCNQLHGHPYRLSTNPTENSGSSGGFQVKTLTVSTRDPFTGVPTDTNGEQIGGDGGDESRPNNVSVMYCIKY